MQRTEIFVEKSKNYTQGAAHRNIKCMILAFIEHLLCILYKDIKFYSVDYIDDIGFSECLK